MGHEVVILGDHVAPHDPAEVGDAFWLHSSRADVAKTSKAHGGLRLVLETGALGGVADGNPVYYREVPVGAVISHELAKGGSKVRITVNIETQYASLVRSNSVFWNASGISADHHGNIATVAIRGNDLESNSAQSSILPA